MVEVELMIRRETRTLIYMGVREAKHPADDRKLVGKRLA